MARAGIVIAIGCLWLAAPHATQGTPSLTDLLDTYSQGRYDEALAQSAAITDLGRFRLRYIQDVPVWIQSDSANAGKRGAAAAAFLLELAHERLESDWHRFADLIEAVCVNLRKSEA